MKTRDFDPVFGAALRNELESLPDAGSTPRRAPYPRRAQVWVTIVTAVVLVAATIGVLRLTASPAPPAGSGRTVVDPITLITDPANSAYVARSVRTLLHARGTGSGTHGFDVPSGVGDVRLYLTCAPVSSFRTSVASGGWTSGQCDGEAGSSFGIPVVPGRHTLDVHVPAGTRYVVVIIEAPGPTVATGALIDPMRQLRDRRNPDAILGDTRALLDLRGGAGLVPMPSTVAVPQGVHRLRVFLVCEPTSAKTLARIDGHVVTGCMNAIAHWFDFTPSSRSIPAHVEASGSGDWALLVVPAPPHSTDSPANAVLPYPAHDSTDAVVARSRGAGAQTSGTYTGFRGSLTVQVTCRGTGYVDVDFGASGTSTRGNGCGRTNTSSFLSDAGDPEVGKRLRWTVTPHGDISWTVTLLGETSTGLPVRIAPTNRPPHDR